jgi:Mce-associated membrane protein
MPRRQQLAASRQDRDETTTDEPQPESEDVEEPAGTPRRRGLFRRKPKAPEAEPVSAEPDEAAEPEPDSGDAAPQEDVIMVPHRPAGKRLTTAAVAASVLFVAAAGYAGAMLQPYLADRALVNTKLDIARTAANAISTLWTYTPDNMDKLPDRAAGYLGGDFANEYRKYIDAIVATNKQAQVTNTTQVMGTAVESVGPREATALVYTNSVATSPGSKNIPSLRYLSYRLTLQHHDAKWLITRMSTVTSFDLTPQL